MSIELFKKCESLSFLPKKKGFDIIFFVVVGSAQEVTRRKEVDSLNLLLCVRASH